MNTNGNARGPASGNARRFGSPAHPGLVDSPQLPMLALADIA